MILLAAAIGGSAVVLLDDDEPPADLTRKPTVADANAVYRITAVDETAPTEDATDGGSFDVTASISLASGATATEVLIDDIVARVGDTPVPMAIVESQTVRFDEQNVPDAVVLIGIDVTGTFYYFADMLFPVVSTGMTSEGDTWPVSFEADLPAAAGTATYEGTGELVGYEAIDGTNAAEISNQLTFEYDYTFSASEAAQLAGGSAPSGTIGVTGTGTMTVIGWIDPATGLVLRSEIVGNYDVVFAYRGFSNDVIENGVYPSSGEFDVTLELQSAR